MPEPRPGTAALIGKGFCPDVYAWGERRALKLFHGRVAPDRAARKFAVSRAVHAAGVSWPWPHVPKDGRYEPTPLLVGKGF
jgi:hypothetical protein